MNLMMKEKALTVGYISSLSPSIIRQKGASEGNLTYVFAIVKHIGELSLFNFLSMPFPRVVGVKNRTLISYSIKKTLNY